MHLSKRRRATTMAAVQPSIKDGGRKNSLRAQNRPPSKTACLVLPDVFGGFRRPGCLVRDETPGLCGPASRRVCLDSSRGYIDAKGMPSPPAPLPQAGEGKKA